MTDVAATYQQIQPYLFTVAYRFTGSASEAEDLVHDAWLRYLAAGSPSVDSLRAYLTTVISRLSLDYLKSARIRRQHYVGPWLPEPAISPAPDTDPVLAQEQRDSISMAMLVLLDRLTPDQRIVYVLRESLDLPFAEIAKRLDRSAASCRQLYHRALVRLDTPTDVPAHEISAVRTEQFIHALQQADATGIATLLASDVVWLSDGGPDRAAARNPIHGPSRVSRGLAGILSRFDRTGRHFSVELLNGEPGLIVWRDRRLDTVVQWQAAHDGISTIWFSRNPTKLAHLARQLGVTIHS